MAKFQDFTDLDFFKCVGNVAFHTTTLYGLYKASAFAINMTSRVASNFNKIGHRIIKLNTSDENQSFIQAICVRQYIYAMLKDDRFTGVVGHVNHRDRLEFSKVQFLSKLQQTLENSDAKFKQRLLSCFAAINDKYANKDAFYKSIAKFNINIAVFITNERTHPKLHIYRSEDLNNLWLLLVDENKNDSLDNLGVITSNTELFASSEEILNSVYMFDISEVTQMLNKYKVEVIGGKYDDLKLDYLELYDKKLPMGELGKAADALHFISQKVRRARRVARILKNDEVSVTRTRTYTKRKNAATTKKLGTSSIEMGAMTRKPPALPPRPNESAMSNHSATQRTLGIVSRQVGQYDLTPSQPGRGR
uniref:Uncharacterized protein n=1 Tax=viral metagenome TaxID=1070528 RepID=A0A6C0CLF4_9ZZZZ